MELTPTPGLPDAEGRDGVGEGPGEVPVGVTRSKDLPGQRAVTTIHATRVRGRWPTGSETDLW